VLVTLVLVIVMVEFSFGAPVKEKQFFNRVEELDKLIRRTGKITQGIRNDVAIIGPRRVGKSSLTNKLAEQLTEKGITVIQMDCEGLTPQIFLREYSNAVIAAEVEKHNLVQKFRESLKQGVSTSIAILSEALGRIKSIEITSPLAEFLVFRIEMEKTSESELRGEKLMDFLQQTLELPEKLGSKFTVIFDEFQETSKYNVLQKGDFHALFRRSTQHQKNVCYVYTGSSIGMMEKIFGDQNNPLAGNADILPVEPFSEENSKAFLTLGLKQAGIKLEEKALNFIVDKTGGFPAYLNWIGLRLIDKGEKNISEAQAKETFDQMLSPASPIYQNISKQLVKLGPLTKKILKIIALGNVDPLKIQKEANARNVYVYLDRLQKYGLVKKRENKFYLIDPAMKKGLVENIF